MNMTKKYIMAHIKIPIEILEDGQQISHMNRTIIDFDACNELPPEQDIDNIDFTEALQQLLNQEKTEEVIKNKWNETTVIKDNLKKKVNSKNMSFRRKMGNNHNFSVKHI